MSRFGPLVTPEALAAHLDDPGVVIADVRWYLDGRSGLGAFEAGHLPGAVFVDLDTVLAAAPNTGEGRHPLPDPGGFAGALGRLGIGDDVTVVGYDDAGGAVASRLWWMLRVIGQDASILDGGIGGWAGALETGAGTARPTVARTPVPWPRDRIAEADDVAAISEGREPGVLLDARDPERYRGEVEPVDARPGHIPGARNVPFRSNLDPATGRFLPAEELRRRYADLIGDATDREVVAYCGSGVTACHDLLALEVAGLPSGRLFPGSWSAWSARHDRPAASGPDPG